MYIVHVVGYSNYFSPSDDVYLGELPEPACGGHELPHEAPHILAKASPCAVVAQTDHAEDLVDGRVGWQRAVKDVELTLETLRNVVTTAARVDHRSQELQQHYRHH